MSDQSTPDSIGLCISLLGEFAIWLGAREIPANAFPRRKSLHLLKLIALQPGQKLHRDQVLDRLWPHLAPDSALAQLYKAVHHVRQALAVADPPLAPDTIFQSQNELLHLTAPGGVHSDIAAFEQLTQQAFRAPELPLLQRAITAYKGDLLPDDLYEEWTLAPRKSLQERYLELLLLAGSVYQKVGNLTAAGNVLRQALDQDVTREDTHRALMKVYALQGSRIRALRQYQRCAEVLMQDVGVEPAPETTALYEEIRRGSVKHERSGYPVTAVETPSLPPLIGRKSEVGVLQDLLRDLEGGKGTVLGLEGDAGIGKTRLARELSQIDEQQRQVFQGGTHEQEGQIPYMPFIEALRGAVRSDPTDAHLIPAELAQAIPELPATTTAVEVPDQFAAQSALFAAVQRFLAARARRSPLILIVDDLHAADSGSLKLFHYLARQANNTPFLMVGIWRTIEPGTVSRLVEIVRNLVRHGLLQRMSLAPLSRNEHHILLEQVLEDSALKNKAIEPALGDEIYHLSAGNPLFALEMMRQLAAEGNLDDIEIGGQSAKERIVSELPPVLSLAPSAQGLVSSRLASLSTETVRMLQFAAVAGQDIVLALLEEWSSGRNQATPDFFLWDLVDEAIAGGLLQEVGSSCRFTHPLFRQIIYQQMSEARRRALHGTVASAMQRLYAKKGVVPVEGVAFHYLQAGDVERAVTYLIEAGKRAEAVYDQESALRRYEEAISVLEKRADRRSAKQRAKIYELMGDVQRTVGNVAQSFAAYLRALEQIETASAGQTQLRLHRKITLASVLTPDIPTAAEHLEKAWALLGDDELEEARMLITQALFDWHVNDLEAAIDHASQALEIAEGAGAEVEASQACEMLAMAHFPLGNWEEGLQYELRRQSSDWSPEIIVAIDAHLCLYQFRLQGTEPYQHVKQFIETIGKQSATLGNLRCMAVCHYALGSLALMQAKPTVAVESLSEALELQREIGSPAAAAYTLARQIELLTITGSMEEAWELVPLALEKAGQAALRDHCLMLVHTAGIRNRMAVSDFAAAHELVQAAQQHNAHAAPCSICSVDRYVAMADYYLATGDIEKAREKMHLALQLAYPNSLGKARALRIQGQIYAREGKTAEAESCISQAAAIFRESDSRFDLAPTLQIWADLPSGDLPVQQERRDEAERLHRQFQVDLSTADK